MSKQSDLVKNDVVKKTVYDKLAAKINNIGTSGPVEKLHYNAKISQIGNKTPRISGLATNAELTAIKSDVEGKIPNISSLVKKTDYSTKITATVKKLTDHNCDKHITTPEFNKFTADKQDKHEQT